jgi:hypothetical protein
MCVIADYACGVLYFEAQSVWLECGNVVQLKSDNN